MVENVPNSLIVFRLAPRSWISGMEKVELSAPSPGALCRMYSRRFSSLFTRGRRSTARTTLKIAALAPMPRARVNATVIHNERTRDSERIAIFRSRRNDMEDLHQIVARETENRQLLHFFQLPNPKFRSERREVRIS